MIKLVDQSSIKSYVVCESFLRKFLRFFTEVKEKKYFSVFFQLYLWKIFKFTVFDTKWWFIFVVTCWGSSINDVTQIGFWRPLPAKIRNFLILFVNWVTNLRPLPFLQCDIIYGWSLLVIRLYHLILVSRCSKVIEVSMLNEDLKILSWYLQPPPRLDPTSSYRLTKPKDAN